MSSAIEFLATAATGLFAGAAVYVSAIEHPARVSCGPAAAVTEFRPSYKRGAVMQTSLAATGCLAALTCWGLGGQTGWLVGGLLLGILIPFTLLVIRPTNQRLFDPALDPSSPETADLLARWGRLHAVRTASGLAAFIVFLIVLTSRQVPVA